ncbi:hypothetical protein BDV96DRAFT_499243 [Lophiotrema nucula]|uniref:Uncharacterized protein n=1 Tax=Lophiotrema nucula TaxID=690887 RepID=A0A6A5YXN5_9PLEO|nr:hypothetical protein BDV96DRAFT_499243 [Lophiotrema nucula]
MKTDNYLNLCLDQAANSPLRYRHGCIIVRGGKVIGQGFNDYRSGFNGGALKTGQLSSRGVEGPAIADMKKRLKLKREPKPNIESPELTNSFTPFEGMGGGKHANTPLSMHSEMMAIHSALSASSTSASSAVYSQKPCFKLSGGTKRTARLRREGLKAYVQTVCQASIACHGDLKPLHLNRANLELALELNKVKEDNVAVLKEESIEKQEMKNRKKNGQQECQYPSGQHTRHRQQYALKPQHKHSIVAPCHSQSSASSASDTEADAPSRTTPAKTSAPATKKQPMLIPKRQTGQSTRSVKERTKLPRLHGADLYVARLGWSPPSTAHNPNICCLPDSDEIPPNIRKPSTGSLYDELTHTLPKTSLMSGNLDPVSDKHPNVLASRPCYRCITYMHSVGIKRVFWTTDKGVWEGAKVRDLVEALDKLGQDPPGSLSAIANVFITKHEVLMLRRMMGN